MNKPNPLVALVAAALWPYLSPTDRLLVGVSGGVDSLALLHILRQFIPPNQLLVAHVNHNLRPEAAAEANFVQQTAVGWQHPFYLHTANIPHLRQQHGWSIEEAARHARYHFFADLAQNTHCRFVAVAHHADDQAETILLHLIRGAGLAGLQGMQPAAPLPSQPAITLLRPLLAATRQQIETYAATYHLQPRQDSSNFDPRFLRNRIRHQLLPLLSEYNPQIAVHLQQLGQISQADYAWQQSAFTAVWPTLNPIQNSDWLQLDRDAWQQQPLSMRRLALRYAIQQQRPSLTELSFSLLESARTVAETGKPGSQLDLPQGLQLHRTYHQLYIAEVGANLPQPAAPQLPQARPFTLPIPGHVQLADGWQLSAQVVTNDTAVIMQNSDPWQAFADVGHATQLTVRPRLPGERLQPLGLHGRHARLKEVMVNRKIARTLRPLWPVVANETHPVWLVGHGIDQRAQVNPQTNRVVWLRCQSASDAPVDN